jgi:hypothetical protein
MLERHTQKRTGAKRNDIIVRAVRRLLVGVQVELGLGADAMYRWIAFYVSCHVGQHVVATCRVNNAFGREC